MTGTANELTAERSLPSRVGRVKAGGHDCRFGKRLAMKIRRL